MKKIFLFLSCAFVSMTSMSGCYAMDDHALRAKLMTFLDGDKERRVASWLYALAALKFPSLPLPERLHQVGIRLTPEQRAMLFEGPWQIRKLLDIHSIERGVDRDFAGGQPLLHTAICSNYRAAFDLIMEVVLTSDERSSVIEIPDVEYERPLFVAARVAYVTGDYFVARLLSYGADPMATGINVLNNRGMSILHVVTTPGAVRLLVAHGAGMDINKQEAMLGRIPLHIAVRENRLAIAQALLEFGASVMVPDSAGFTSLDHAYALGNEQMIQLLKQCLPADADAGPSLPMNSLRILLRVPHQVYYSPQSFFTSHGLFSDLRK